MTTEAYTVGRFYSVPHVRASYCEIDGDWPVLGNFHEDSEHIKFTDWHWHLDVRFVPERLYRGLRLSYHNGDPQEVARRAPVMVRANSTGLPNKEARFSKADHPKIFLKRRKMARHVDPCIEMMSRAPWTGSLEKAYADEPLAKGHCPHRGADLSTFAPDAAGCVECPLHGLVFRAATGCMVPRKQWLAELTAVQGAAS